MNVESPNTYSQRLHLPALGYVQINLYSSAALCFDIYQYLDEINRQSNIPHLGLISLEYSGSQHTRWEYATLQCAIVDIIDHLHKGNPEIGLGSLKIGKQDIPGSEILKSWVLLSNFGHCKNTLSDEKAILNCLRRDKYERRKFLDSLPDGGIKPYAKSIITNYLYTEFHWLVAILRLQNEIPRNSRKKRPLQHLIRLLKTDSGVSDVNREKLAQLRYIFGLVRKMAIVSIDSRNSHLPVTFDLSAAVLAMDASEKKAIGEGVEAIVDPILGMLTDILYVDKSVQCIVRDYEIQAGYKLDQTGFTNGISEALKNGLVSPYRPSMRHVHRQVIPIKDSRDIYDERRKSERLVGSMGGVRVQVDENWARGKRYVDFLFPVNARQKADVAKCIYIACRNLFNTIAFNARDRAQVHLKEREWWRAELVNQGVDAGTVEEVDRKYMARLRSEVGVNDIINERCAAVVVSVMQLLLREPLSVTFEGGGYTSGDFGLDLVRGGDMVIQEYTNVIDSLIKDTTDEARENELRLIRQQTAPGASWLRVACLDRILVFDPTRPPQKRRVAEIDGCTITACDNAVRVDLFEAKLPGGGATGSAKRKLKEIIKPIIKQNLTPGHRVHGYRRGAKLRLAFDV
jgi:hypothetical protein